MKERIKKINLIGSLSGKTIIIEVDTVVEMCKAYMVDLDNSKRSLSVSLKVLRFHDALSDLFNAEEIAGLDHINKKLMAEEARTAEATNDIVSL